MSELKELFANTFPDANSSAAGRSRVAEMALSADRKVSRSKAVGRRIRLGFGFGLATLVVGAGIVMAPSITTAAYMRHLGSVVKDARSAHIIEWSPTADGGRKKVREMWYQGGRWRVEAPMFGTTTITDGAKQWVYRPDRNTVRVNSLNGPFMGGGFTLSSMVEGGSRLGRVSISEEGKFKRVSMDNPIDHSTILMWVDKASDYPVRGAIQSQTPRGTKTNLEFSCEFNQPLDDAKFLAKFPADAKVIDRVGGEKFWAKELSKSLATFTVPQMSTGQKVVLRNVQVTEGGDVYLLYSGSFDASQIQVTDSLGNMYVRCDGFQPQMDSMDQETHEMKPVKGIQVDGRPLEGGWWTPVTPSRGKWMARKLNFALAQVTYRTDPEEMKKLPKGAMVKLSDMHRVSTPVGTYKVTIDQPTCGDMPDYMPYMGMGPDDEFDISHSQLGARAKYLLQEGRFIEAEPVVREDIRLIEEQEATKGQSWVKSSFFFDLYRSLKGQGKHAEAKTWLSKVQNEPGGAHGDVAIEQALKLEGL